MKVKDLTALLNDFNPEAEVVIHRDNLNFGYGKTSKILTGVFEETDYGNDFLVDQNLIVVPAQVRAICLYPEDCYVEPEEKNNVQR